LDSVKASPKIWADAWNSIRKSAYNAAWNAAYNAAWNAAYNAVINAAYNAAWNAARNTASYIAKDAAYYAALGAITALFAYDDAAKYLDLPLDQLKMLYALSEHPAALLLQPAVLAFSMERELA
jgi:hypothetical protein